MADTRRRHFEATLKEAEAEADLDGTLTAEQVAARIDRMIDVSVGDTDSV